MANFQASEPALFRPGAYGRSEQAPTQGSVGSYLRAIRRHWVLVICVGLAALIGAGVWAAVRTRQYQSTAQIVLTPVEPGDSSTSGLPVLRDDSSDPAVVVQTASALVRSNAAAQLAASRLGSNWTPGRVLSAVSVQPQGGSRVLDVTATSSRGRTAALVANTFAQAALDARTAALQRQINTTLTALTSQLHAIGGSGPASASLTSRINALTAQRRLPDPTLSLAQPASSASSPSGPSASVVAPLALFGGLVLGCAAAILLELVGSSVRREEDVSGLYPAPVLARIPALRRSELWSESSNGGPPVSIPPAVAEAYRALLLQVERQGKGSQVIMLTSPSTGEGKTTSAFNLAAAAAAAGRRVVLLEFDLRRPSLGARLGFSHVLEVKSLTSPSVDVRKLLQEVPGLPKLQVLATGGIPRDPAGLERIGMLEEIARRVPDLIAQARQAGELVVVDSAPLTELSDSVRALPAVDDVLLVARLGQTRRPALRSARDTLERAGRPPTGLVLIGADKAPDDGYADDGVAPVHAGEADQPTYALQR